MIKDACIHRLLPVIQTMLSPFLLGLRVRIETVAEAVKAKANDIRGLRCILIIGL